MDRWAGAALAALGAGLLALTFAIPSTEAGLIGPRLVPRAVAALIVAGGLALVLRPRPVAGGDGPARPAAALAVPALGLAYVWALPWVGYLIATALAAAAALVLFGLRRPGVVVAAAAGIAAGLHLVFAEAMGLFLPRGRLIDLALLLGL